MCLFCPLLLSRIVQDIGQQMAVARVWEQGADCERKYWEIRGQGSLATSRSMKLTFFFSVVQVSF